MTKPWSCLGSNQPEHISKSSPFCLPKEASPTLQIINHCSGEKPPKNVTTHWNMWHFAYFVMSVKIKGNSLPLTFYVLTAYLKYFSVARKAQRHFLSLESGNMNNFIEIMSDSIEIDFLAQTHKCFHVPWVIPHMCGCLFWNVEYLLLIPGRICSKWWEEPL